MKNPLNPKNLAALSLLCFILPGFLQAGEVKGPQGATAPMAPARAAWTSAPIPALRTTAVPVPSFVALPEPIQSPVFPTGQSQVISAHLPALPQSGELSQPQAKPELQPRVQASKDDMALLINTLDSGDPLKHDELALASMFDSGAKPPTTREVAEGQRVTQQFGDGRGPVYLGALRLTPEELSRQQKDIDHGIAILRGSLSRWGLDLTPNEESDLRVLDLQVAQLNALYGDAGYHGSSHQTGAGSVAELAVETLRLRRPQGMSGVVFKELLLSYYKAARVHDVEGVFVYSVAQNDGTTRYFLKYADSSKPVFVQNKGDLSTRRPTVGKFDLGQMGDSLLDFETRGNRYGTDDAYLHLYPKSKGTPQSPGTRSYLLTTLRTIDAALPRAQDPVVKYLALKGTAFSKEEFKLADKLLPILEKKIREKYEGQADQVLEQLNSMAEQLGGVDFFDHYVRRDGLLYISSLQDEFQDPYVKLAGTFGFFESPLGGKPSVIKDKRYVDFYAQLPRKYREALVRNFVYLKIVSVHKDSLKHDIRDVLAALDGNAAVQKLLKDVPVWSGLGLAGAYNKVKGLDVSGLKVSI